mgnify:CR=1 FL=1
MDTKLNDTLWHAYPIMGITFQIIEARTEEEKSESRMLTP